MNEIWTRRERKKCFRENCKLFFVWCSLSKFLGSSFFIFSAAAVTTPYKKSCISILSNNVRFVCDSAPVCLNLKILNLDLSLNFVVVTVVGSFNLFYVQLLDYLILLKAGHNNLIHESIEFSYIAR